MTRLAMPRSILRHHGTAPAAQRAGRSTRAEPPISWATHASSAQMLWLICPRSGSSICCLMMKPTLPLVVIRNGSPTFLDWAIIDCPKRVNRPVSGPNFPGA